MRLGSEELLIRRILRPPDKAHRKQSRQMILYRTCVGKADLRRIAYTPLSCNQKGIPLHTATCSCPSIRRER